MDNRLKESVAIFRRFLFLFFLSAAVGGTAEPIKKDFSLPLWEAGLLGGGGYSPDYPAAGQNHWRGLGTPYLIYRGSIFRADRDGARASLVKLPWVKLELSAAGSFPASSKHNRAREGMPDLDWLGEFGPRLMVPLWKAWGYSPLRLYVPLRAVFSTDLSHIKHRGYTLTPKISFHAHDMWRAGWVGLVTVSANFGDRPINAYFYDVQPQFSRPDRPAYDARTGYVGSDLFLGLLIPFHHSFRVFVGGQLNYHDGSANADSPLFKKRLTGGGFLGLGWTFYESKEPAVGFD